MNSREPSRTRLRVRPSPRYLALLLLPVLAPEFASAAPRPRPSAGLTVRFFSEPPIAYLRHIDPVPLRVRPAPLPPAPWSKTMSTLPGEVVDSAEIEPVVAEAPATSFFGQPTPGSGFIAEPTLHAPATSPESLTRKPEPGAEPTVRPPAPILIDDLRPTVRPEDFLPFFLLPGTHSGDTATTIVVPVPRQAPAPGTQPPSSATFTRSP